MSKLDTLIIAGSLTLGIGCILSYTVGFRLDSAIKGETQTIPPAKVESRYSQRFKNSTPLCSDVIKALSVNDTEFIEIFLSQFDEKFRQLDKVDVLNSKPSAIEQLTTGAYNTLVKSAFRACKNSPNTTIEKFASDAYYAVRLFANPNEPE